MSVDPLVGTEVADYRIDGRIGHGGMGDVYLAQDLTLERRVALKLLRPAFLDDPKARQRFQREIESAVAVEHPHIVPVYAAGYDGAHFFLVMRYIDGPDLSILLRREGPLAEERGL